MEIDQDEWAIQLEQGDRILTIRTPGGLCGWKMSDSEEEEGEILTKRDQ